ncbi:hypothetical protein [Burkholderia gladioli]|uniref:hypothetical protein n=1 Tax=Burkholderia gladioli TaxID=28095 RepID=UPI000BBD13EE|nr:hypothetical protein [Burkholderia gladioli]ATF84597.1 hypothetical protein CO712_05710 [Burkholderia gladioli pv. gladioli]
MTCTQQQFERDVSEHAMTIHRDDGVDRHVAFKKPGTSCYWFEILTWAGALCIRGDCGTYVFSRLNDMFEFFRGECKDSEKLYINSGYWCEKLQSVDCDGYGAGKAREFSQENFAACVKAQFNSHLEDRSISPERRAALWAEIQSSILDRSYDGETRAFDALTEFHDKEFPRLFQDCWEWNCKEYTHGFIWNLYAIAWAIRQYDAAKQPA